MKQITRRRKFPVNQNSRRLFFYFFISAVAPKRLHLALPLGSQSRPCFAFLRSSHLFKVPTFKCLADPLSSSAFTMSLIDAIWQRGPPSPPGGTRRLFDWNLIFLKKLTQRSNEEIWREFPSDRRPIHFYDVSLAAHRYVSTGGAQEPAVASTVRALGRRFTKKITSRGHKKWANRLIKIVACGFCSFFFYFDQFAYDPAHIVAELCANSAWAEQHINGRGTLLDSALDSTPNSTKFKLLTFLRKIFRWNGVSIWSIYELIYANLCQF